MVDARVAVTDALVALDAARTALDKVMDPDIGDAQQAVSKAASNLKSAQDNLIIARNDSDNAAKLRTLEYEAIYYRNKYGEAQVKFNEGKIDQQKLDWEYSNMLAAEERLNQARVRAESSLANAQEAIVEAQEAYDDAVEALSDLRAGPDALELGEAQGKVAQAESALSKAHEDLAEMESGPSDRDILKAEHAVAQADYNLAKAEDNLADMEAGPDPKDIEIAQAKVTNAQTALEEAEALLEAAEMKAPFAGTVISVGADVGDLVSSGSTIITVADLSDLRVRAMVDETDISKVAIGQDVSITFDAFPGYRFSGQVLEVPLQGEMSQSVLIYEVPINLERTEDVAIKSGMTANLSIVVGRRRSVLLVPAMAVQLAEDGNVVSVIDPKTDQTTYVPVELGLSNGIYTEVMNGLNEGDRVLVRYDNTEENLNPFGGPVPMGVLSTGQGRVRR